MSQSEKRLTPFPLRVEPEVRDWYAMEAKKNSRSLNSELAKLLKERMNRVKGQRSSES